MFERHPNDRVSVSFFRRQFCEARAGRKAAERLNMSHKEILNINVEGHGQLPKKLLGTG